MIYGFTSLAAGVAPAAHAADMLDEVTVTATRLESRIGEVPATVSTYSSQRIETLLAQNIKDLVRFEPGVSVRSSPARFTAAGSSTGRDGNSGFNVRGLEGGLLTMSRRICNRPAFHRETPTIPARARSRLSACIPRS